MAPTRGQIVCLVARYNPFKKEIYGLRREIWGIVLGNRIVRRGNRSHWKYRIKWLYKDRIERVDNTIDDDVFRSDEHPPNIVCNSRLCIMKREFLNETNIIN
tara:strand:- start:12671 stop:12976 length:306 start_codon:yes stop_codon:yes gene_type:complete